MVASAMFRKLLEYFRPPPIEDRATFERFLSGEASYLAQRATYEFTRNTLAWFGQHHFGYEQFNDAFRICRWESFATILAGFSVAARDRLVDPGQSESPLLNRGIIASYRTMLLAYDVPRHRTHWDDATEELRVRLLAAEPVPLRSIAAQAARRIFDHLPVKSANQREDLRVIGNAVEFGTVAFHDRMMKRLSIAPTRDALCRDTTGP
jgi:hypothetical protein